MASFSPMLNRFRRIAPKTEASDEYADHIANTPQREPPSIWRRIAAGLAGGLTGLKDPSTGMKVAGDIMNRPFESAVADHGMRTPGLLQRAKLEQEMNEASFDFEKDMLQREETARYHDMINQQREEDREQRKTAAEAAAAQKDVDLSLKEEELHRRSRADELLANYRSRMAGASESRAKDYGNFVGKYGQKQESDRVTPVDQQRIRKLAVVEAVKDPRFSSIQLFSDGTYDTSKVDPKLREEFEQAIRLAENGISKKRKRDYDFIGGADVTDDDLEFERRLQEEDEDSFWR